MADHRANSAGAPRLEQQLHHRLLSKFGGPTERRRADVLVAGIQIGAVIDEPCRRFHIALSGQLVQRRDAEPVALAGIHSVCEQQLIQFTRLRAHHPTGKTLASADRADTAAANGQTRPSLRRRRSRAHRHRCASDGLAASAAAAVLTSPSYAISSILRAAPYEHSNSIIGSAPSRTSTRFWKSAARPIEGGIEKAEAAQGRGPERARAVQGSARRGPSRGRATAPGGAGAGRHAHRRDARGGPAAARGDHRRRSRPDRGRPQGRRVGAAPGRGQARHRPGRQARRRVPRGPRPAEPHHRPLPRRARGGEGRGRR